MQLVTGNTTSVMKYLLLVETYLDVSTPISRRRNTNKINCLISKAAYIPSKTLHFEICTGYFRRKTFKIVTQP